jgi:SAM-dependent methyltransferase
MTAEPSESIATIPRTLLHVGCGPRGCARIPGIFSPPEWQEVRLDIEPAYEPDILGTMLDMSSVATASVDAIYSSHNIEHLFLDEVPIALKEFLRVLKPDGFALVVCPDLHAAAQMILAGNPMGTAYSTVAVDVTPLDIIYGHHSHTGRDKPFMSHHCGFTLASLIHTLKLNGFSSAFGIAESFSLWVVASKPPLSGQTMTDLTKSVLLTV